jgi:hypothetical protein
LQNAAFEEEEMPFLILVFLILLTAVVGISWISGRFVFAGLQPPFVGALVGAAGTIFAGCIAYTAASDSVSIANENLRIANVARDEAINERKQLVAKAAKDAQASNAAEVRAIEDLKWTVDRLVARFSGAQDTGPNDYFALMFKAEQGGAITPRFRRKLPEDLAVKATDAFDRLGGLRNGAMRLIDLNGVHPPQTDANRIQANLDIKEGVQELQGLSEILTAEIKSQKP